MINWCACVIKSLLCLFRSISSNNIHMYHIFAEKCNLICYSIRKGLAIILLTNTCISFVHAKRFSTPRSARCPPRERAISLKIEKLEKNQAQAVPGGQQVQRNLDESD